MQRSAQDPTGVAWEVEIDWIGRKIGRATLIGRFHAYRMRRKATAEAADPAASADSLVDGETTESKPRRRASRWAENAADGVGELVFQVAAETGIGVAILAVVLVVVFIGPGTWFLAAGLIEFVFVLVVTIAALVWRTVTRSTWAVVARRSGLPAETGHRWDIVGYRRARRVVRAVTASIEAGTGPGGVDPTRT